jgi:hypothetical protein
MSGEAARRMKGGPAYTEPFLRRGERQAHYAARMTKHGKSTNKPSGGRGAPWWLENGGEECPHCEQAYGYEAELRCARCDAPICAICVVREGGVTLCPDCRKGAR